MPDYELQPNSMYTDERGVVRGGGQPNVIQGAVFDSVSEPTSAGAGGVIAVTGKVGMDVLPPGGAETRVVAEWPGGEKIDNVGHLNAGENTPFRVEIPAPQNEGQKVEIHLKAQRNPAVGGWATDNEYGPIGVNIISQQRQLFSDVSTSAGWAAGGGGAGYLVGRAVDVSPTATTVGGAAIGVGAQQALGSDFQVNFPELPTMEVLALAALFGTGALLLSTGESYAPVLPGDFRGE